jgi:hypothetical protein
MAPEVDPRAGRCPDDEALAALLDGALAADERGAIEAHAVACDDCRAALADASRALAAGAEEAEPGPGAAAIARAVAAGGRPAGRVSRLARVAAAAALLLAAVGVGTRFLPRAEAPHAAPAEEAAALVVSSVSGWVEVRPPGAADWRPLVPGERLAAGAALRSLDREATGVGFEGDLSVAFRGDAQATVRPGRAALEIEVASGGLALSPPKGLDVHLVLPQGQVTTAGAPLEVLVKRRQTLVVARAGAGVRCATRHGELALEPDHHTILFDDRPPLPPRVFPFRHRGARPGGRPPCQPPGGPELDGLFKDGPT